MGIILDKATSLERAIDSIHKSEYVREAGCSDQAFFKMELEAVVGIDGTDDYYEEEVEEECGYCEGSGLVVCGGCEDETDPEFVCSECENTQELTCGNCDGERTLWVTREVENESDYNLGWCRNFVEDYISPECRDATVYFNAVYDGSVDLELHITLPLTLEGLRYGKEYIGAMVALYREIQGSEKGYPEVSNAGMHLTILRSPTGNYPPNNKELTQRRLKNFKESMNELLPALYFLGSEGHRTRGLSYRRPMVCQGNHGSAVESSGYGRVLEWRVFDTCYSNPDLLDEYICVIAKGLQYYAWHKKDVTLPAMELQFNGNNNGKLHNLYHTAKHLDALKAGLKYLKPDHRTMDELFKMKNFTLTKSKLREVKKRKEGVAREAYKEALELHKIAMDEYKREVAEWKKLDKEKIIADHIQREYGSFMERRGIDVAYFRQQYWEDSMVSSIRRPKPPKRPLLRDFLSGAYKVRSENGLKWSTKLAKQRVNQPPRPPIVQSSYITDYPSSAAFNNLTWRI